MQNTVTFLYILENGKNYNNKKYENIKGKK